MKQNKPAKKYGLDNISVKEIVDKYPDKVMNVSNKSGTTTIVIPHGRIIFSNKLNKNPSSKNIEKVLRNNKHN
jgi:hypothetical protein